MFRYVHTNIIAKDVNKLIDFYKKVFHCKSINETRDLRGVWLDGLTGLNDAHITGEHLLLPGYVEDHPTLEIFSYDKLEGTESWLLRLTQTAKKRYLFMRGTLKAIFLNCKAGDR